jgi:hypothetical protein
LRSVAACVPADRSSASSSTWVRPSSSAPQLRSGSGRARGRPSPPIPPLPPERDQMTTTDQPTDTRPAAGAGHREPADRAEPGVSMPGFRQLGDERRRASRRRHVGSRWGAHRPSPMAAGIISGGDRRTPFASRRRSPGLREGGAARADVDDAPVVGDVSGGPLEREERTLDVDRVEPVETQLR